MLHPPSLVKVKIHPIREVIQKILRQTTLGIPNDEFFKFLLESLAQVCGCTSCELLLQEVKECIHLSYEVSSDTFKVRSGPERRFRKLSEDIISSYKTNSTVMKNSYPVFVPIKFNSSKKGMLILVFKVSDWFTEDPELFEEVGQSLAVALTSQQTQAALVERVKELTCLYGIAKLAAQPELSLEALLESIVSIIPSAWQYPECASAQIVIEEQSFATSPFQKGRYSQVEDILVRGQKRGFVEVTYTDNVPDLARGPFLDWERQLIRAIARQLGIIFEKRISEKENSKLEQQLRHADRLATIGQLTAGVAHELNEPLSNILGFAQLAKKASRLPEQTVRDLCAIEKATLHAREVIRKLMYFGRQMPQTMSQVNLNELVEDSLFFLASRCEKADVEIQKRLYTPLPHLCADSSQLHQVLVNLVVNSIQAMNNGGVLCVRTECKGNQVVLSVCDTGSGMTEEVKRQVFVPFFSTKDVNQGTGLGLPVVHGIVSVHGGTIKIESQINKGTNVSIFFPIPGNDDDHEKSQE